MQVLLTNPEVDTLTRYLLFWTRKMLKENKNRGNKYFRLERWKATRAKFEGIAKKKPIDLILLCGHGGESAVYGDTEQVVLDLDNIGVVAGKTIHALSCRSAKGLGTEAVKSGARAYIGYREDFIAFLDESKNISNPLEDGTAALFLDAAFAAPRALLKGKSPSEAVSAARKEYVNSIKKALNSDVQSDDDQFINWLFWDRDNLVCLEG